MSEIALSDEREFEILLEYVRRSRGFDFTGYKRSTLLRRFTKRRREVGAENFAEYLNHLEAQPEEFNQLFNTVLINVTSFFRDPASWEFVSQEIVPHLLQNKPPDSPIRVWCPGSSSGEEAYTAAIVLAEHLSEDAFRSRVKIYGTDVDEADLALARQASYGERQVEAVPEALRAKYFERVGGRYCFRKDLRRAVIFGRHDLLQDPPISRIDWLVCRNTLMYFNAEAQANILNRLHFALNEGGFLFLGKAEMLLTRAHLFTPVEVKHRVFAKVNRLPSRDRTFALQQQPDDGASLGAESARRIRELALEAAPVALLVVDAAGVLAAANERARAMFGLAASDTGRLLRDLELSYRPLDLRSLIDKACSYKRPVGVVGAEWLRANGQTYYLDVQVVPIFAGSDGVAGVSIAIVDASRLKQLEVENLRGRQELETFTQELQAANEELETMNEELQSTNEELETTNEELQSANEELETMNEELQSTNQELETINDELRQRTDELVQTNAFRDGILASLDVGVVVLDRDLRVQVWNRKAADLWGLREDEVGGRPFLNLDIGLPMDGLRRPLLASLAGEVGHSEVTLAATERRGKPVTCRVRFGSLPGPSQSPRGIILLMEVLDSHA